MLSTVKTAVMLSMTALRIFRRWLRERNVIARCLHPMSR
jgi:hypothetical protein